MNQLHPLCCSMLFVVTGVMGAFAQTAPNPNYPGGCETPVTERPGDAGCYLVTSEAMQDLPESVYWHLYTYPTMAAARGAKARNGVALQSLGKFWVFTLSAKAWKPQTGERVAVIGPLQLTRGIHYTARYMESIMPSGHRGATGHTHSGPEAFYIVSGAQCLETPSGPVVSRAGESVIVQGGPPMGLSGVGSEYRRAVFVVLHDSKQPWITRGGEWTPPGRCPTN